MFSLFIVLLSFSESLATKCLFLNDEPCIIRPTLIDMNPVEVKYYPFMISLNKCAGSCNFLSQKICVPKETKDMNVEAFNMITNKCDSKCKFNSTTCNSNQKWNNKRCQCECKNYRKCKKDYSWNPSACICEKSKFLKSIADVSVTECDEIIIVMDFVSTKKTNTIATQKDKYYSNKCYNYYFNKLS